MTAGQQLTAPAAITDLGNRIQHWRSTRTKLGAMPHDLWIEAGRLAREHGVYTIAKSLRLNFEALRAWSEDTKKERRASRRQPAFVQLGPLPSLDQHCITVELEGPSGAKMTIRVPGGGTGELMALVGSFFNMDLRR